MTLMLNQNSPPERLVLITGASRGIGLGIALELAKQGFRVVGTATSEAGTAVFDQALSQYPEKATALVLNLEDQNSMDRALQDIQEKFGRMPDVLVNNAGITADSLVLRMKFEAWQKVIHTNLSAVFYLTQACVKTMLKNRWGRVINIGSVVGSMGNAGQSNYCAAKAGLIGLTKSLAKELGSRNITVNLIAPGFIETDMTKALVEVQQAKLLENIPLARMGNPTDVAYAVAFLASEQASYITGATLHVNGGLYMN